MYVKGYSVFQQKKFNICLTVLKCSNAFPYLIGEKIKQIKLIHVLLKVHVYITFGETHTI